MIVVKMEEHAVMVSINTYTCMCVQDFEGENCTDYTGRRLDNYMTDT